MSDEPVFCEDCDYVHPNTRREQPYRWLCMKAPRKTAPAFTTRGAIIGEPYDRCQIINWGGQCGMFEPKRHWMDRGIRDVADA